MKPEITLEQLEKFANERKSPNYKILLKRYKYCFGGDIKVDVPTANKIILSIENNNTAHSAVSFFKWAFNTFYGQKFNPKYVQTRPAEISKFTTRLTKTEIDEIRAKYYEWINDPLPQLEINRAEYIRKQRLRYYLCFEALLCSGMRIGELCSIDWKKRPAHRLIRSNISGSELVEIIINTEKVCKKREIYIPLSCYENFCNEGTRIKANLIKDNFVTFRRWAKLPFKLTAHVLRRTKASFMHECGVDLHTIAMVLGNTPKTVMNHYIISSTRNYDACDIADCAVNGHINKTNNLYFNNMYLEVNKGEKNDKR